MNLPPAVSRTNSPFSLAVHYALRFPADFAPALRPRRYRFWRCYRALSNNLSPADPAARWTGAHGGQAFFSFSTNYLINPDLAIIVDVDGSAEMLKWSVEEREIEPHIPVFDKSPAPIMRSLWRSR